jgi:tetratricopeptide (TPR) repeat protein
MALSFWGWEGNQQPIAAFTKPNSRDKNVMPYELVAYVEEETEFGVVSRMGGDIELLKRFLASGFPVMIEKGFEGPKLEGWMGHYVLVTAYNDADERFTVQDSYYGPDQVMRYEDLKSYWRAFNFTLLVVYPMDRKDEVIGILGPLADEEHSYRLAAEAASNEIYILIGRDQFFAWFNRGTSLMRVQDYAGAAQAYDEAFLLYPSLPEKGRPWRMMWYQTGPYWAYYYTGRYQDVIDLSTKTLDAMSQPVMEESYYWRAPARFALGDNKGAIKDLSSSLEYHPGFEPALIQFEPMEAAP